MNIESFFLPLALAGISGITFIAYKHSGGFQKIYRATLPALAIILVYYLMKGASKIYAGISLLSDRLTTKPGSTLQDNEYLINILEKGLDGVLQAITVGALVFGYLFFLYKLPEILKTEDDKKDI